jgi:predicted RNA-binding protein with PUA-like domain
MSKKYWLMKTEPDVYSIDHLVKDKTTWWEGVRNYQARNFMAQEMSLGDEVLFYHSSADPSGIAGLAKVSKSAAPDKSQFDKKSEYYDAASKPENPRWMCVQVQFVSKFKNFIPLSDLKNHKALAKMGVLKKGNRLSIQPVTAEEFEYLKKLGGA